eukprot:845170-Amphidinium_carterae.1
MACQRSKHPKARWAGCCSAAFTFCWTLHATCRLLRLTCDLSTGKFEIYFTGSERLYELAMTTACANIRHQYHVANGLDKV